MMMPWQVIHSVDLKFLVKSETNFPLSKCTGYEGGHESKQRKNISFAYSIHILQGF